MAQIVLDHVDKVHAGGAKALDDSNLKVGDGEFMVLVARPAAASRLRCGRSPGWSRSPGHDLDR